MRILNNDVMYKKAQMSPLSLIITILVIAAVLYIVSRILSF